MVKINFLKKIFMKNRLWQVILSVAIFFAIIVSCSISLPTASSSVQSNLVTSSSSTAIQTQVSVVGVEVDTLPTRTTYTPVDVVST